MLAAATQLPAMPFSPSTGRLEVVVNPIANHLPITIPLTLESGFDVNTITISSDASWVSGELTADKQGILVSFASQSLITKTSSATILLSGGDHEAQIAVQATTSLLNLVAMESDPLRRITYAVQQDGVAQGAVLLIDQSTGEALGFISVGDKPSDLAITADAQELLVISSASQDVAVIDLVTRQIKETFSLPNYDEWGINDSAARIAVGPGSLIYYSDGNWESNLRVYDRSSKTVRQTLVGGVGDLVMLPDESAMVGWYRYGWTAGSSNSYPIRFTLDSAGQLGAREGDNNSGGASIDMRRNPLSTPAIVSRDGSVVILKQHAFRPDDLEQPIMSFAGPVYAASPYAEFVATESAVYDFQTGNQIIELPVTSRVQSISSDYSTLVYFDSTSRKLGTVELLDSIWKLGLGGGVDTPLDNSVITPPGELRWNGLPGVTSYRVYVATTEAGVREATSASPHYLGEVSDAGFTFTTPLETEESYYWRIDAVTAHEVIAGRVRHFKTSTVAPSLTRIDVATVQGHRDYEVSVDLTSVTAGASWTTSSEQDWISFSADTGTAPGQLRVHLDASLLEAANHEGAVTVTHDAGSFSLPVYLTVDALVVTHFESAPDSATVYAVSEDSSQLVPRAYLLELDSTTETILRTVPVGESVTDLAYHSADRRVYVTNWRPGKILAVNVDTLTVDRTYAFKPFTSTGYGEGDPFRVAAGGPGRIIVEEEDQWIDIYLYDTVKGEIIAEGYGREGGGATSPDGRYYYHGDSNISNASLHRFDTLSDTFTDLGQIRVSSAGYYGSRTVVASEDGQRIFWNGSVFDPLLNELWTISDEVFSTNADGSLGFAKDQIYNIEDRELAFTMPTSTRVSAFNSTSEKLIVQQNVGFGFYDLTEGAKLEILVLNLVDVTENSVRLNWLDRSLEISFTVQYRLDGVEDWTDFPSVTANTSEVVHQNLPPLTSYEYRARANSADASSAWSTVLKVKTLENPPAVPQLTRIDFGADDVLRIQWSEASSIDRITIEKGLSYYGEYTQIAELDAPTAGEFLDRSAIQPGTTYYYRLQAHRADRASGYSGVSSVNVPNLSAPSGYGSNGSGARSEGQSFALSFNAYGYPFPTLQWRKGRVAIPGATDSVYFIANLDLEDAGVYDLVATNTQGTYTQPSYTLAVTSVPVVITGAHSYKRHGYRAGEEVGIGNRIEYVGRTTSLGWQVLLPEGWSLVSTDGIDADVAPVTGQTGLLEWAWITPPDSPIGFSYVVAVPEGTEGDQAFAGLVIGTKSNQEITALLNPDPMMVPSVPWHHSADANHDEKFSLSELLRVIEIYNTRHGSTRTGRYQTNEETADRYATDGGIAGDAPAHLPDYHSADFDANAQISLSELLRIIELYNTRTGTARTGAYRIKADSIDGYDTAP